MEVTDTDIPHVAQRDAVLLQHQRAKAPSCGVVILDANGAAESGWACVHGQSPFRIKSVFALPGDVIWWSNVPFRTAHGRLPRTVRSADFLKIPFQRALAELGLTKAPAEQAATALAGALHVILGIFARAAPSHDPQTFTTGYLYRDLERLTRDAPIIPSALAKKLKTSAAESWTSIAPMPIEDTLTFRAPRLSYALMMLDTDVPSEDVTWRQPAERDPMARIRETMAPCYAEFAIQDAMPRPAQLFGLGSQPGPMSHVQKTLAAHPELLALDAFATLQVKGVWTGKSYTRARELLPAPLWATINSREALVSWSAGVAAETIVRCLMATRMPQGSIMPAPTWRGFWLRSSDKVGMFCAAMSLNRAGYSASAYGYGWVRVQRPDTATSMAGLLVASLRLGLLPEPGSYDPAIIADILAGRFGEACPDGGWGKGKFTAHANLHDRGDLALLANDMPILSPAQRDKRQAAVLKVLSASGG